MISPAVVTTLLILALLLAGAGAWRRMRMWRRGRPAAVNVLAGLLAIPRRYFVDVHDVVLRDRYAARMHVAAAGGFAAAFALLLLIYPLGFKAWVLRAVLVTVLTLMLYGARLVANRRRGTVPANLSRGAFQRLPNGLFAFATGFFFIALLALFGKQAIGGLSGLALLALVVWGLAELVIGATWGGPLKHAFAGALHLAFHPRPERFSGGKRSTALKPLDLQRDKLGVERPIDFKWNQLLGFDACVQCGRCETACPAFAAGQPLNPKKLIQDLVVGLCGPGDDRNYAGSAHPGRQAGQQRGAPEAAIVPDLISAETLWACTTCRACVYECPMMIEHVDAVIDLRRFLTLEKGATPGKGAQALEEMRATDNPGGFDLNSRIDWAVDQHLRVLKDLGKTDVLFWLGDGAFDRRVQRSLRAVFKLLWTANVDFAVLGGEELDCGDLARRLGDEATFQSLARRNIEILSKYRFNLILTADPHALHCLRNEYPAFGGRYNVVHHTTFLAGLVDDGRLRIDQRHAQSITYHDPCYLGRYNGEVEAPRQLLRALGADLREMQRSGLRSRCCGGGGGAPVTDIPGRRRIPDIRMEDARETGAGLVAVACPNCTVMLEGVVGPRPEVKDIAELLAEAVGT